LLKDKPFSFSSSSDSISFLWPTFFIRPNLMAPYIKYGMKAEICPFREEGIELETMIS